VRRIYGWAIRRDMIKGVNPAAGIARFGELRARNDYLNAEQIHAFWHSIDSWPGSEAVHLVIKLCLVTGQRESQVVGIGRDELDLKSREPIWHVPSERSKNKVGHELPLTPLALSLIQRAMEISPHPKLLFPTPKGTTHIGAHAPTTLWKRAKKVRGENGLAESRLADLRTTVGSHLAKLRVDPTTIAAVLDHRSVLKGSVTMKHYVGYDFVPEKREALLRWDRRLHEIIAGQLEEGPRDNVVPLRA
jgi:integrase